MCDVPALFNSTHKRGQGGGGGIGRSSAKAEKANRREALCNHTIPTLVCNVGRCVCV